MGGRRRSMGRTAEPVATGGVPARARVTGPRGADGDTRRRIGGIEWLRALASVAVVAVHMGYWAPSAIFDPARFADHVVGCSDVVNFYGLLLAVPVFMLISTLLLQARPPGWATLASRLRRIGVVFAAWVPLFLVARATLFPDPLRWFPDTPGEVLAFVLSAGESPYYFFVALALVLAVAQAARPLGTAALATALMGALALVAALPPIAIATGWWELLRYWNPLAFLPYSFAGALVWRLRQSPTWAPRWPLVCAVLIVTGSALAVLDWTAYRHEGLFHVSVFAIPAYARPSLAPLATAVVIAAVMVPVRVPGVVRAMAGYSLALYCLHPFAVPLAERHAGDLFVAEILAAVVLSYGAAVILRPVLPRQVLF